MTQEDEIARASEVQTRHEKELMQKAHVVGVGVGLAKKDNKLTQQICLIVMVDEKVPLHELEPKDRIPPKIEGICTDVQETGIFTAQ